MQSNEEIWGEDKIDTYGRENLCLLQKKVSLCGGRDREVAKYGCYFNPRSYSKSTSPWEKSQWDSRVWVHMHFFQSKIVLDIHKGVEDMNKAKKEEEKANLEEEVMVALIGQLVDHIK